MGTIAFHCTSGNNYCMDSLAETLKISPAHITKTHRFHHFSSFIHNCRN